MAEQIDHDEHHRNISDGWFRAAIFGISDGLVTNTSFILGFAGASPGAGVVRVAGVAALIAGAFSMGSGEYISVRAQRELLESEIEVERRALQADPDGERRELEAIFLSRGIDPELASRLSEDLMRDPDLALRTHVREELGMDPDAVGNPWSAAFSSFGAFSVGALLPLVHWLFTGLHHQVETSVGIAAAATLAIGASIGWFSRRGVVRWALIQTGVTGLAAAVTYFVGHIIGSR